MIATRLRDGRKAKAAKGGWAAGRTPFGYRSEKKGERGPNIPHGKLVAVPAEQAALARMLKLSKDGASSIEGDRGDAHRGGIRNQAWRAVAVRHDHANSRPEQGDRGVARTRPTRRSGAPAATVPAMTEIRKTSETDIAFPHGWDGGLCYFEIEKGELLWTKGRNEIRDAVRRAHAKKSQLYCAWPGRYRTDLFLVDDLKAAAKALGVDLSFPARSAWVPPTPEEQAKSRWRRIHIRTGAGDSVEEVMRRLECTAEEVEAAWSVEPSEKEAREIASAVKRIRTTAKAAATRARNKAAAKAAAAAVTDS